VSEPRSSSHVRPGVLVDAHGYCDWAGLRLPADVEWQYAVQGQTDGWTVERAVGGVEVPCAVVR
jgi:formylglycine-generating enzyme required for sulfatase activity